MSALQSKLYKLSNDLICPGTATCLQIRYIIVFLIYLFLIINRLN